MDNEACPYVVSLWGTYGHCLVAPDEDGRGVILISLASDLERGRHAGETLATFNGVSHRIPRPLGWVRSQFERALNQSRSSDVHPVDDFVHTVRSDPGNALPAPQQD